MQVRGPNHQLLMLESTQVGWEFGLRVGSHDVGQYAVGHVAECETRHIPKLLYNVYNVKPNKPVVEILYRLSRSP